MKQTEIEIGKLYENDRGDLCRVAHIYKAHGRPDNDLVCVEIVKGRARARYWLDDESASQCDLSASQRWQQGNMRRDVLKRRSMARWAKRIVSQPPEHEGVAAWAKDLVSGVNERPMKLSQGDGVRVLKWARCSNDQRWAPCMGTVVSVDGGIYVKPDSKSGHWRAVEIERAHAVNGSLLDAVSAFGPTGTQEQFLNTLAVVLRLARMHPAHRVEEPCGEGEQVLLVTAFNGHAVTLLHSRVADYAEVRWVSLIDDVEHGGVFPYKGSLLAKSSTFRGAFAEALEHAAARLSQIASPCASA